MLERKDYVMRQVELLAKVIEKLLSLKARHLPLQMFITLDEALLELQLKDNNSDHIELHDSRVLLQLFQATSIYLSVNEDKKVEALKASVVECLRQRGVYQFPV
ncbi:MAG: hypothetical protein RSA50_00340 [Mucinivorans sp.]